MQRIGLLRRGAVALALVVGITAQVEAVTIVDTGPGPSSSGNTLSNDRWLAAEFTVGTATMITGAYGWIVPVDGGDATVALHADNAAGGDLPGTLMFSAPFSLPAFSYSAAWYGPSGLTWSVTPGTTYWLAFEVRSGQSLFGSMPTPSITPLGNEALTIDSTHNWYGFDSQNIGVRVYGDAPAAVPEPATLLLLGSGLAGIGGAAWRRKKKESAHSDQIDA